MVVSLSDKFALSVEAETSNKHYVANIVLRTYFLNQQRTLFHHPLREPNQLPVLGLFAFESRSSINKTEWIYNNRKHTDCSSPKPLLGIDGSLNFPPTPLQSSPIPSDFTKLKPYTQHEYKKFIATRRGSEKVVRETKWSCESSKQLL